MDSIRLLWQGDLYCIAYVYAYGGIDVVNVTRMRDNLPDEELDFYSVEFNPELKEEIYKHISYDLPY